MEGVGQRRLSRGLHGDLESPTHGNWSFFDRPEKRSFFAPLVVYGLILTLTPIVVMRFWAM